MDDLFGFILAAFALTGSPGPATLSLAAVGAAFGPRRGLGYLAGIILGVLTVLAMTAGGLTSLIWTVPAAASIMSVAAAGYIVYLAWKIATASPLEQTKPPRRAPSIGTGLFLSLANPKAYAAMAALASGFVLEPGHPAVDTALKAALLLAILLIVDFAWLLSGGFISRLSRSPVIHRRINLCFAGLLIVSVVFAAAL